MSKQCKHTMQIYSCKLYNSIVAKIASVLLNTLYKPCRVQTIIVEPCSMHNVESADGFRRQHFSILAGRLRPTYDYRNLLKPSKLQLETCFS